MKKSVSLLSSIRTGQNFEEFCKQLLEIYFRKVTKASKIKAARRGEGPDGGIDILIEYDLNDFSSVLKRKWVVQCKYKKTSVTKSDLSNANIPTLIREYNADGYLLVTNNDITTGITTMFENLNREDRANYKYEIIRGDDIIGILGGSDYKRLIRQYVPKLRDEK